MLVTTASEPLNQVTADVLIVTLTLGATLPPEVLRLAAVADALAHQEISAAYGKTAIVHTVGGLAARKVLVLGLGDGSKLNIRRLRRAAGIAARAARQSGARHLALAVPVLAHVAPALAAQAMTEGVLHGLHQFQTFKQGEKQIPQVETLTLAGDEIESGMRYGLAVAEATNLGRAVNWLPGNHLTPAVLADKARAVGQECGLEVDVYDKQGCEELGLGLLLTVNQGSTEEPRFIVMRYRGNGGQGPWLGVVGKGVTFDTGGISIKPSANMWDMKYDMAGAGAVLGAMQAIANLGLRCDVLAVIGATDNMPDGNAYKPGDVVSGLSGKTVEIRSTDAEGRLVLADGVAYARRQGCDRLISVATLTGATVGALGPVRFGLVTNDDAWEEEVFAAAEEAGELSWRLPHDDEYVDLFKSPIADMANLGTGGAAGVQVGGLFVTLHAEETPLVHMDIAAVAWNSAANEYEDAGATGVAVKTLVRVAARFANRQERM